MQLGLSSLYLIGKPFEFLVRSIELHDVLLWEIVDENTLRLDKHRVQTLQKLHNEKGVTFTIHAPFTDVNIASLVPEVREMAISRLKKSLFYASELEARGVGYASRAQRRSNNVLSGRGVETQC